VSYVGVARVSPLPASGERVGVRGGPILMRAVGLTLLKFLEDGIENASEIVHYIIVADAIDAVSHAIERRCAREIRGDFLITPMRRAIDFDD
jgi:hypothetical protein